MMYLKKISVAAAILAVLLAAGEFLARRSFLRATPDLADLFELSILDDGPVFAAGEGGLLSTRPELVALDNFPVRFMPTPEPGVKRIFCVGGSTTAGWPFHPRGSFPARLELYLGDFLGGRAGVEVINAGFHNFDSRRETSVASEAARFKPDIAVIYSGYNELQTYYARAPLGALRAPHRFLTGRSALYNLLRRCLGLSGDRQPAEISLPVLKPAEEEKMFLRFRLNLTASARALKAGGASIFLLEPVWTPGYTPPFPGPGYMERIKEEIAAAAQASGASVIRTGEFIGPGDFVDAEHFTLAGYGKLGLGIARALCAGPLSARGCRQRTVRGEAYYAGKLGADDPAWLAGVQVRLALVYCFLSLEGKAGAQLELAEAAYPGRALKTFSAAGNRKALELLALTDDRLGYPAAAARAALADLK